MTSTRIENLKKQKKNEIRRKSNQIPYAILGTSIAFLVYLILLNHHIALSGFWIVGILIGITMQRSRFCFAASFRDPIMIGSTSILKAVILGLILSTIGFFIVQYRVVVMNPDYLSTEIPGQLSPVGIHTVLGAILFGIGMVVAGGCASGVLVRVGEGHMMQMVVLMGFVVGSLFGAKHFPFWNKILIDEAPVIYLPAYFGFFPSLILQLLLLFFLYFLADWYDKKNNIMVIM